MNPNPIPTVRLRGETEELKSVERRHPWLFSGAFIPADLKKLRDGETVYVVTKSGEPVGTGYYERGGGIAIRLLSFELLPNGADEAFFTQKIADALLVRRLLGYTGEKKAYRLIYGEGDGLPGLIIDVYAGTAVMQAHTIGIAQRRDLIASALLRAYGERGLKGIYYKSEGTLRPSGRQQDPHLWHDTPLYGEALDEKASIFEEDGVLFRPDIYKGQKTGFFLDQRDNRLLLRRYSEGKKVLNMFCYTGGFTLGALKGGAESVTSVDSSEQAIALLEQNLSLNPPFRGRHTAVTMDAFKYLEGQEKLDFDVVVLDPPAFAKNRNALPNALQGYRRLNALALEKMPRGSILFTFSCSQVVTKELFRQAVFTAALQAGRNVRILHQLSQAADHPINLYHPEGEYLKGLVLYVE